MLVRYQNYFTQNFLEINKIYKKIFYKLKYKLKKIITMLVKVFFLFDIYVHLKNYKEFY